MSAAFFFGIKRRGLKSGPQEVGHAVPSVATFKKNGSDNDILNSPEDKRKNRPRLGECVGMANFCKSCFSKAATDKGVKKYITSCNGIVTPSELMLK